MRIVMGLVCLLYLLPAYASGLEERLEKIDSVMQKSAVCIRQKELKIRRLREMSGRAPNPQIRLKCYDELYTAYYTYRFDSAMTYVDRSEELAKAVGNAYYRQRSIIYRSVLLATSGLYSQSVERISNSWTNGSWTGAFCPTITWLMSGHTVTGATIATTLSISHNMLVCTLLISKRP